MADEFPETSKHPGEWFSVYDRTNKYAVQVCAKNRDMCDLSRGRYAVIGKYNAMSFDIWPKFITDLLRVPMYDDGHVPIKVEYWDHKPIEYSEGKVFSIIGRQTCVIHTGGRKRNFRISLVGRLVCVQNGDTYQISHNGCPLLEYNDPNLLDVWITKISGSKANKKNLICRKYFQDGNIYISSVDHCGNTNTVVSENILDIEILDNVRIIRGSQLVYITDNDTGITITSEIPIVGYPEIIYLSGQYSYIRGVGKFYNNERKIWLEEIGHMSIDMYRSLPASILEYIKYTFPRLAFYMNGRLVCCATSQSADQEIGHYVIAICHDLGLSETPEVFSICGNDLYYKDKDQVIIYNFITNESKIASIPGAGLKMIRPICVDGALFLYEDNQIIVTKNGTQISKSVLNVGPIITSAYYDKSLTVVTNRKIYQLVGDVFLKKRIVKYSGGKKKPRAIPIWAAPDGIATVANCHAPMRLVTYTYVMIKHKGPLYYTDSGFVYSREYETSFKFGVPIDVEYFGNYLIEIHPDGARYLNYNGVTIAPFDNIDLRIENKSSKTILK